MPLDTQILVQTFEDLRFLISFLVPYKWIVLPVLAFSFFLILKDAVLFYSQSKYKDEIEWDIFEIRIPREIEKGPKAMEQFFAGLWSLWNIPSSWKEKYVDGEVTLWFSFEIVGSGGKVRFFARTPKKRKHAVESMLYAEYPDIEIGDAEDYTAEVPDSLEELYRFNYDLFGSELRLKNAPPYPINTYVAFEEKGGEERIVDPISVILELLNRLKPEERFWIQIIVRPANPEWQKEGEKVIKEIREKTMIKSPAKEGATTFSFPVITPAEEQKMKAVAMKVSKPGFETLIRHLYIAPKDIFDKNMSKNIGTYFSQYGSSMNYFLPNFSAWTRVNWWKWPYFFPGGRNERRKRNILYRYKKRYIPEETLIGRLSDPARVGVGMDKKSSISILNSEELATLYHPPTNVVLTAPTLDRIESKKISPPGYIPF